MYEENANPPGANRPVLHYYGDTVRKLFISGALIMVLSLPIFSHRIAFSPMLSIISIVVIALAAGFAAPKNKWVIMLDLAVSTVAFLIFEWNAVNVYKVGPITDGLFIVDQALAVIFIIALYFSTKTLRSIPRRASADTDILQGR